MEIIQCSSLASAYVCITHIHKHKEIGIFLSGKTHRKVHVCLLRRREEERRSWAFQGEQHMTEGHGLDEELEQARGAADGKAEERREEVRPERSEGLRLYTVL